MLGLILTLVPAASGCPDDDTGPGSPGGRDSGVDVPVTADGPTVIDAPDMGDAPDTRDASDVSDSPTDGLVCPLGLKPFYRDPGCDAQAVAVCAASDDGCFGPEICTCEGTTSRLCSWSEKPFRHYGACGTDGGQERPSSP